MVEKEENKNTIFKYENVFEFSILARVWCTFSSVKSVIQSPRDLVATWQPKEARITCKAYEYL